MNTYVPINCGFHDRLEAWSVLRQTCQISYRDGEDVVVEVTDQIVDVYAKDKADYLKLKNGTDRHRSQKRKGRKVSHFLQVAPSFPFPSL